MKTWTIKNIYHMYCNLNKTWGSRSHMNLNISKAYSGWLLTEIKALTVWLSEFFVSAMHN